MQRACSTALVPLFHVALALRRGGRGEPRHAAGVVPDRARDRRRRSRGALAARAARRVAVEVLCKEVLTRPALHDGRSTSRRSTPRSRAGTRCARCSSRPLSRLRGRGSRSPPAWAVASIVLLQLAGWHTPSDLAGGVVLGCLARVAPELLVVVVLRDRDADEAESLFESLSTLRSSAARRFSRPSSPRTRFCSSSTRSRGRVHRAEHAIGAGRIAQALNRLFAQVGELAEQIVSPCSGHGCTIPAR